MTSSGNQRFVPDQFDDLLKSPEGRDMILDFIDAIARGEKVSSFRIFTEANKALKVVFADKKIRHLNDIFSYIYKVLINKNYTPPKAEQKVNRLSEIFLRHISKLSDDILIAEIKAAPAKKAAAAKSAASLIEDDDDDDDDDDDIIYPDQFLKDEEEANRDFIEDYDPKAVEEAEKRYKEQFAPVEDSVIENVLEDNEELGPLSNAEASAARDMAAERMKFTPKEEREIEMLRNFCPEYLSFPHVLETITDTEHNIPEDKEEDFFDNVIWPYGVTSYFHFFSDKLLKLLYKHTKNGRIREIMRTYALTPERKEIMEAQAADLKVGRETTRTEEEILEEQPKRKRKREEKAAPRKKLRLTKTEEDDDKPKGSGILSSLLGKLYVDGVSHYFNDISNERKKYKNEKKQLESKLKEMESGGSAFRAVDLLAGPVGWVRMGVRAKREKELKNLRKRVAKKTLERELRKNQESLTPPKDLTGAGKGFYFYY